MGGAAPLHLTNIVHVANKEAKDTIQSLDGTKCASPPSAIPKSLIRGSGSKLKLRTEE